MKVTCNPLGGKEKVVFIRTILTTLKNSGETTSTLLNTLSRVVCGIYRTGNTILKTLEPDRLHPVQI
jgi:hypothetical protein